MTKRFAPRHLELRRRRKEAARRIGRRVKTRRVGLGMKQAEVADEFFSAAYISAIERGLAIPSLSSLLHLSTVLHVRPTYFLWGIQ